MDKERFANRLYGVTTTQPLYLSVLCWLALVVYIGFLGGYIATRHAINERYLDEAIELNKARILLIKEAANGSITPPVIDQRVPLALQVGLFIVETPLLQEEAPSTIIANFGDRVDQIPSSVSFFNLTELYVATTGTFTANNFTRIIYNDTGQVSEVLDCCENARMAELNEGPNCKECVMGEAAVGAIKEEDAELRHEFTTFGLNVGNNTDQSLHVDELVPAYDPLDENSGIYPLNMTGTVIANSLRWGPEERVLWNKVDDYLVAYDAATKRLDLQTLTNIAGLPPVDLIHLIRPINNWAESSLYKDFWAFSDSITKPGYNISIWNRFFQCSTYAINPNPYADTDGHLSQRGHAMLQCGIDDGYTAMDPRLTLDDIMNDARAFAVTPKFPLVRGAMYKAEYGCTMMGINLNRWAFTREARLINRKGQQTHSGADFEDDDFNDDDDINPDINIEFIKQQSSDRFRPFDGGEDLANVVGDNYFNYSYWQQGSFLGELGIAYYNSTSGDYVFLNETNVHAGTSEWNEVTKQLVAKIKGGYIRPYDLPTCARLNTFTVDTNFLKSRQSSCIYTDYYVDGGTNYAPPKCGAIGNLAVQLYLYCLGDYQGFIRDNEELDFNKTSASRQDDMFVSVHRLNPVIVNPSTRLAGKRTYQANGFMYFTIPDAMFDAYGNDTLGQCAIYPASTPHLINSFNEQTNTFQITLAALLKGSPSILATPLDPNLPGTSSHNWQFNTKPLCMLNGIPPMNCHITIKAKLPGQRNNSDIDFIASSSSSGSSLFEKRSGRSWSGSAKKNPESEAFWDDLQTSSVVETRQRTHRENAIALFKSILEDPHQAIKLLRTRSARTQMLVRKMINRQIELDQVDANHNKERLTNARAMADLYQRSRP